MNSPGYTAASSGMSFSISCSCSEIVCVLITTRFLFRTA